jgi:hypothetical protein
MDFIQPRKITSPISGQPVTPRLKTYIRNGKEVVEAEYIDPASGTFIRKGIVSVKDIKQSTNNQPYIHTPDTDPKPGSSEPEPLPIPKP